MKAFLKLIVAQLNDHWAYILMGCITILICNVLVIYFIGQEYYIYYWDYANYWDKYNAISKTFTASPVAGLTTLIWSVRHSEYNFLPVFALIPFHAVFGPNRLGYILVLANAYGIAAVFSMVIMLRTVVRWHVDQKRLIAVSLIGLITTALLPQFWSPILFGYPDVVGIILINLILHIHFRKPIEEGGGWSWTILGLSLCCLVLLRRWYAYWVVSYFVTFGLERLVSSLGGARLSMKRSLDSLKPVFAVGVVASLSMLLFATPIARTMVMTNYADIYSAYKESASFLEVLARVCSRFGAVIVLLFIVSVTHLTLNRETRGRARFLLLQLALATVLFSRTQDFLTHHYYLLIPTLLFFVSVWAARSYLALNARLTRGVFLSGYLLVLVANFCVVFVPSAAAYLGSGAAVLSRERHYPLVRGDIAELRRMLSLVEQLAGGGNDSACVLASSVILNDDILRHAGEQADRSCAVCGKIVTVGHVDKRDRLRRAFWDARWVIVADPIQYHLRPEDQRVVGIPASEILNQRGIGLSYKKLTYEFALDNGVKAYVYEKVRPFEKGALESVEREFLKYYPEWGQLFGAAPGS